MQIQPLKRNKNILQLSRDHHYTLLFCWKIRQGLKHGAAPARISSYVRYFWEQFMLKHFEEEERLLFISTSDDLVRKALEEHQAIRRLIELITNKPQTASPEDLTLLAGMVERHVRYEERLLFPHLEKTLSTQQLKALGEQLETGKPVEKDNYSDNFWFD